MYHYHIAGTCIAKPDYYQGKTGSMTNFKESVKDAWTNVPYRTALGIAKDFGLMPTSWQQVNNSKLTFLRTALLRTRPDALLTVDISNPHAL